MAGVWLDIRYAVRALLKNPGFTVVAVAALALGTGANTAIFTMVDALLVRPLPYPESERLVLLARKYPDGQSPSVSMSKFLYWRKAAAELEEATAFDVVGNGMTLSGAGDPERVPAIRASAGFWKVFGVQPSRGRGFTAEEDRPGGPAVAVIAHGLWQRRFGGDEGILNRVITLGGRPHSVVGVMPAGFQMTPDAEVWTPLRAVAAANDKTHTLFMVGRVRPGVGLERAQRTMDRVAQQLRAEFPDLMTSEQESATALRYRDFLTGDLRTPLLVLLGAVGFVLLIACANVANLLLARATGRAREIAIRAALGASGGRVLRQLLTESVLLGLAGGAAGVVLAHFGVQGLMALGASHLPRAAEIGLNGEVLAYALGVSVLTGLLFGLAPAWQMIRVDLNQALREGSGRATGGRQRGLLRDALVAGEVGLAVVLLAGALLLARSFSNLANVPPGFDARDVLTFQLSMKQTQASGAAAANAFTRKVLERLHAIPGVQAAALVTNLPTEMGPNVPMEVVGGDGAALESNYRNITLRYFEAMKMRIVQGRAFSEADQEQSEPVAIVSESFVRQWLKGRDPLGATVRLHPRFNSVIPDPPRRIVGVLANVKENGLAGDGLPTVYVPTPQLPDKLVQMMYALLPSTWVVRTAGAPASYAAAVRRAILEVDREQAVANVRTMETVLKANTAQTRMSATLLSLFAALALALAAVGVYGVLSYAISQRTSEIGLRVALGAGRGDVLRMVLRRAFTPAGVGVVIGLGTSFGLTRILTSQLYGVTARDPLSFAAVPLVLLAVCLLAALGPALRALRVDPIVALRYE